MFRSYQMCCPQRGGKKDDDHSLTLPSTSICDLVNLAHVHNCNSVMMILLSCSFFVKNHKFNPMQQGTQPAKKKNDSF